MKLNAQQLIDNLQQMQKTVAIIEAPDWQQAIRQSIEAVKALQLIARDGTTSDGCECFSCNGGWCSDKAKAVFHE